MLIPLSKYVDLSHEYEHQGECQLMKVWGKENYALYIVTGQGSSALRYREGEWSMVTETGQRQGSSLAKNIAPTYWGVTS